MSLVNDMLRDLEERRAAPADPPPIITTSCRRSFC